MGCCVLSMINNQNGPIIIAPDRTTTTLENEIKEIEKDNKEKKESKEKQGEQKQPFDIKRAIDDILVKETKADPYTIYDSIKKLGEGAFGSVEEVKHKISGAIRAMKIIDKTRMKLGSEEEEQLINEINILKTLDHPNIMKVFEYYNYNNHLYIISEFISGGELFDKITENHNLKEDISSNIMKQIFSAINFCHENNIVHRDLKPENILIEKEEKLDKDFLTIKIIDFGTCDKIKKGEKLEKQVGTPYYTAPEVNNKNYDKKCDLWSCGVILYVMLAGKQPFNGDNDEEINYAIQRCKIDFNDEIWDNISNDAKDLIKKLLIKNPKKRYSAKDALNHPWIKNDKNKINLDQNKLKEIVDNLRKYSAKLKLQQATMAYIVHNLVNKKDYEYLRQIFIYLDNDKDGKLDKKELINGLMILLDKTEAKKEVDRLFEIIDVDKNGFIEYEEFLRAGLDKGKILTEYNLDTAFKLFDINNKEKMSEKEKNVWQILMEEAGININEGIKKEDFKRIIEQC